MQSAPSLNFKVMIVACALGMAVTFAIPALAQEAPTIHVGNADLKGMPDDWTHHHLVFHDPGNADDAFRGGRYDEWFRIVNDPRYVMQQMKQHRRVRGSATDDVDRFWEARERERDRDRDRDDWRSDRRKSKQSTLTGDWSMVLGSGAAGVGAGMFPAKYSFSTTATPTCSNVSNPDFVVYNTGNTGSPTQASVVAYDNLYKTICTSFGPIPSVYWAFNTGGKVVTSVVMSFYGNQLAYMQSPASGSAQLVLLTWKATPAGRSVTSGGTNITNGSKNFTTQAGTALTSMDVGAAISGTGIPIGDTIASVTSSTAGTLFTAATSNGTASETLAISADAGGPDTLSSVGAGSFFGCTAPCMTTLTLTGSGTRADTISSPFYDYNSDTLFVGDGSGGLHKFHPVFNGTPAEIGSPWVTLGATAVSSPVYDVTHDLVFAGDGSGFLYSVDSAGTVTKSIQVAVSPGIVDGPLVDSSTGFLYAVVSKDTNGSNNKSPCSAPLGTAVCNGVIQLPWNFGTATSFKETVLGVGTANTLYEGAFDDNYWSSGNGTGALYAIGGTAAPSPKLSETAIASNVFGTSGNTNCRSGFGPPSGASAIVCSINVENPMTSAAAMGSPVTEIKNGSTDYIFASVTANGNETGCSGATGTNGCIYSWSVGTALGTGAAPHSGAAALGGTSGISIDNTSITTGASQVYYSTLGATGACATSGTVTAGSCAIQASQSGLN